MANTVGSRLHTVRHDGTITQHMVSLPVVKRTDVQLIAERLSGIASKVANVKDGIDGVVSIIIPNGIVTACCGFFV